MRERIICLRWFMSIETIRGWTMQVTSGKKWQTSLIKDPSIHHSVIGNLLISTQSLSKAYETKISWPPKSINFTQIKLKPISFERTKTTNKFVILFVSFFATFSSQILCFKPFINAFEPNNDPLIWDSFKLKSAELFEKIFFSVFIFSQTWTPVLKCLSMKSPFQSVVFLELYDLNTCNFGEWLELFLMLWLTPEHFDSSLLSLGKSKSSQKNIKSQLWAHSLSILDENNKTQMFSEYSQQ